MKDKSINFYILQSFLIIIFFLNFIIIIRGIFKNFPSDMLNMIGDNNDTLPFLNFWVSVLGPLASFAMVLMTYKSIVHSSQENKLNRDLEIRNISYNCYVSKISSYKSILIEILTFLSRSRIERLVNMFSTMSPNSRYECINTQFEQLNYLSNSFYITFVENMDSEEKDFVKCFEVCRIIYIDQLRDLLWLWNYMEVKYNDYDEIIQDSITDSVELYKQSEEAICKREDSHRIWKIIKGAKFDSTTFLSSISRDLLKNNVYDILYSATMDFIKYENKKSINILNGENTYGSYDCVKVDK